MWGVFYKRGTKQAALATLIIGFLLGAVAFFLDLPVIGTEKIITHGWGIPFMMQAWWLFCISSVIFFVVSWLTPKPDPKQIEALTWDNPLAVIKRGKITGLSDPRIVAGILFVTVCVLYYIFR